MIQPSRVPLLPKQSPSDRARRLHDRAHRTRWLADMTMDDKARNRLHAYAEELDREADAADQPLSPPGSRRDEHRDAG